MIDKSGGHTKDKRKTTNVVFMRSISICVNGDALVGKTHLVASFTKPGQKFNPIATAGADVGIKEKITINNQDIRVIIWDLAGQHIWKKIRWSFYQGKHGLLSVFDLTREDTLEQIPRFIEDWWKNNGKGIIPCVLVGNNIDLRNQFSKCVTIDQGMSFAQKLSEITKEYGFEVPYFETSAITGENVNKAFSQLIKMCLNT